MTKEELALMFGEAVAKVYSPECRQKAMEKLYQEQQPGNTPDDEKYFAIKVELTLNRQLLFEVLERVLCKN